MFHQLALVLSSTPPMLDDHLENLLLLGIGFILVIFALIVCDVLMGGVSKTFEASAGWLEHKSARRRRKRAVLRKHYPPLLVVHSHSEQSDASFIARDALRRNAEAHHASPTRTGQSNVRLVKPRQKV